MGGKGDGSPRILEGFVIKKEAIYAEKQGILGPIYLPCNAWEGLERFPSEYEKKLFYDSLEDLS